MKQFLIPVSAINRIRPAIDGQGIRTLICTSGCPLRCKYCINPQSWDIKESDKFYTVDELYNAVKVDNLYFLSTNGGITFGGGEPGLYAPFIKEFSKRYGKKWTVNLETSLNFSRENLKMLQDVVDYFYIDIKDTDPDIYKAYTGGDNDLPIRNLEYLCENKYQYKIQVRVPEIERFNTTDNCDITEKYCRSLGITDIDRFQYIIRGNSITKTASAK